MNERCWVLTGAYDPGAGTWLLCREPASLATGSSLLGGRGLGLGAGPRGSSGDVAGFWHTHPTGAGTRAEPARRADDASLVPGLRQAARSVSLPTAGAGRRICSRTTRARGPVARRSGLDGRNRTGHGCTRAGPSERAGRAVRRGRGMTELYLHEMLYRGRDAIEKLAKASITICGAGALGSLLADNLARQGAARLAVIDFDRVEAHNIGTQLYRREDVGGAEGRRAAQPRLPRHRGRDRVDRQAAGRAYGGQDAPGERPGRSTPSITRPPAASWPNTAGRPSCPACTSA